MRAGALLRGGAAEEDVVDDDPGPGTGHGGYARHPGGFHLAEEFADGDLPLGAERDARASGVQQGWRERRDEVVNAEPEPWPGEDRLQAAGDGGLPGTGAAVEHDDLSHDLTP